jgi:hypothetical protein
MSSIRSILRVLLSRWTALVVSAALALLVIAAVKNPEVQQIKKSMQIKADPKRLAALFEDLERTPEWNPLVRKIIPGKAQGRGLDSTVDWEAEVAGIKLTGSSTTIAWNSGREYAWKNSERQTGLSLEGRFILTPVRDQTQLTAIVTYSLPKGVNPLLDKAGANRLLDESVGKALSNINLSATKDH